MLNQDPFYFGTIRNIVAAVGCVFNDLHIQRTNADGTPAQRIKVPLSYGQKEKFAVRRAQQPMPGLNSEVEIVLPRMSYEIVSFDYDPARKLTSTGRLMSNSVPGSNTTSYMQYNPVPYNIGFRLDAMVRTVDDGLMIVEQIIPFFTPDYTLRVKDVPQLNLVKDIPIVMKGMTMEDTAQGEQTDRRTITYTFALMAKAYIYPPVQQPKVILQTITNLHATDTLGSTPNTIATSAVTPTNAPESNYGVTTTITENE